MPFSCCFKTTILVASSLKPNKMNASFLPNLKVLYASMHDGSTLTPDDYIFKHKNKIYYINKKLNKNNIYHFVFSGSDMIYIYLVVINLNRKEKKVNFIKPL